MADSKSAANAEPDILPVVSPIPEPDPVEPAPFESAAPAADVPAADRLRAFEDKVFGADVTRIDGQVERGVGSRYAGMTDDDKARYAKLEKLVHAEAALATAEAALMKAMTEHEAALKAVDDAAAHE